jgi:predicted ATPase
MMIRLLLFGSPTIEDGGESFALPFERRSQLLAFLALKRSWVGRAELAAMLWPEQENKLAYANLRKTLFRLQSFAWGRGIEVQGGALRLEAETDVWAFESALREGRIADALPLRRGELLAGFDDDGNEAWSSWLGFERDRLRVAWRTAALERLALDIDPGEGIELSTRLLEADPLDEAALRAQLSWLARNGQAARAREAYRAFADRLADDLGLTPGAELRALHDSLGAAAAAPARAAMTNRAPEDGFVGRTAELRRIAALLAQDNCRLLSLIGPGGVGKTRLAQRAVQELAPGYANGATFVPLEDIASGSEFGGRLALELDIRLTGSGQPLDQVIEFLRNRQMLLVLDNFEQLVGDASMVERLLRTCARLKIIVTSRVRLAVSLEWLFPIEGLPCPEIEDQDRIESFDAARLFVQAARRVEPALVPSVEASAIVDICHQVDGLPLALELAAAWTRVLSCDAIAAELRQSTELLHATNAAQPARHASMEVVFDHSWRLLSDVERNALARLSVFRGGFSAEAARAVAGAPLPVLGALADKSLLRKEQTRIHLHPLVQQLAAARQGDDSGTTQAAHAAYFHRLLTQLKTAIGAGERAALQSIEDEFENCKRAWAWSIEQGQTDALTSSAAALHDYCDHRGRFEDGLGLFRQALESPLTQRDPKAAALLLSIASHFEYRMDHYASAEANAARALAATRENGDRATRKQALNVLATCALRLGRLDDARHFFKQVLEEATPDDDAQSMADTLDHLALLEKSRGQYDEALRLSLQSLGQYRRLADVAGEALCLNNLASLHLARHDYEAAGVHLREALEICERAGIVNTRGYILANLIEVELNKGDLAAAEAHARRALEVATRTGNRSVAAWVKLQSSRLAVRRGKLDDARSALADGLGLATTLGTPSLKFDALVCFAEILEAQGEAACARRVMAFGADHPSASEPIRDELRKKLAQRHGADDDASTWPGIQLDELVHRIVVESDISHAPLIATLRGSH